jgi:uncharacterized protein (TIGR02118 family)
MIKVSVFYPNQPGSKFDIDYYCNVHIPMAQKLVGSALKGISVDRGLSGGAPGTPPEYVAIGHLMFDSIESFQQNFGPHAEVLMGDVPNFTSVQPRLQFSEIYK